MQSQNSNIIVDGSSYIEESDSILDEEHLEETKSAIFVEGNLEGSDEDEEFFFE